MAKIYKRTDKIPVQIDNITIYISPLTLAEKNEAIRLIAEGTVTKNSLMVQEGILLLMKCSIKDVKGLQNADQSDYKLTFTESGRLSDECIDELLNIEIHQKLLMMCSNLTRGIPTEFVDDKGLKIPGVDFLPAEPKEATDPN